MYNTPVRRKHTRQSKGPNNGHHDTSKRNRYAPRTEPEGQSGIDGTENTRMDSEGVVGTQERDESIRELASYPLTMRQEEPSQILRGLA